MVGRWPAGATPPLLHAGRELGGLPPPSCPGPLKPPRMCLVVPRSLLSLLAVLSRDGEKSLSNKDVPPPLWLEEKVEGDWIWAQPVSIGGDRRRRLRRAELYRTAAYHSPCCRAGGSQNGSVRN